MLISYFHVSFSIVYENWSKPQVLSLSPLGYNNNLMAKESNFGN